MRAEQVLVRRLIRAYDNPEYHEFYRGLGLARIRKHPPVGYRAETKRSRDDSYDLGRVRYFVDRLLEGEELRPIKTVDNLLGVYRCGARAWPKAPSVDVVDGHHRLWAYWLVRRRMIPVCYSGRADVLDYLTGKRARLPSV
jgi:hypothetical protein